MLSTSGDFMSMAWAATHNKRPPKHCRATKRIDLQRPRRQVNLGCNAHKKELTQNAHGDEHIGNTVSSSASAYQGTAVIHLLRRPLRALGCAPEAIMLVRQKSNEQTFGADLARQIATQTLQVLSRQHSGKAKFGVLIRVA